MFGWWVGLIAKCVKLYWLNGVIIYALINRYACILLYISGMIEYLTPSVYNVTPPMVTCRWCSWVEFGVSLTTSSSSSRVALIRNTGVVGDSFYYVFLNKCQLMFMAFWIVECWFRCLIKVFVKCLNYVLRIYFSNKRAKFWINIVTS